MTLIDFKLQLKLPLGQQHDVYGIPMSESEVRRLYFRFAVAHMTQVTSLYGIFLAFVR